MSAVQEHPLAQARRHRRQVIGVVGLAVLVTCGAIWWVVSRDGNAAQRQVSIDGEVMWTGEGHDTTLGPGGWFVHGDEDGIGSVVRHAPTGRSWTADASTSWLTPTGDGRVVELLGEEIRILGEGTERTARGHDIRVAHGDKRLMSGDDLEVVGVSGEHVAVVTCMSPRGGRLGEAVDGGTLVVAGVRLDDAEVTWAHDTGAACDTDVAALYDTAQPAQRYALLHPAEDVTEALDLDTGEVADRWEQAPTGRVVVQGERAMHRDGDEVTVTHLGTGAEVAQVSCPGARLGNPGSSGGLLSEEGTLLVRCGASVRLLDGSRFVTVDAPTVGEDQLVPDGQTVAHDRLLLTRDGGELVVRDALDDVELGRVDVPADLRIAANEPRGRLVAFYRTEEETLGDQLKTEVRLLDARQGTLLVRTDRELSPGVEVSPDGYAVLQSTQRPRSRTRGGSGSSASFVVGVRD